MSDFCPIRRVDHLELYVGNAKQAAAFYRDRFGFAVTGYRGLETGSRNTASYLLTQGDIRFVVTGMPGVTARTASRSPIKHSRSI